MIPKFEDSSDDLVEYDGDNSVVHLAESKVKITTTGVTLPTNW